MEQGGSGWDATDAEMRRMRGAGDKRRVGWEDGCGEEGPGQADAHHWSARVTSPKRPRVVEPYDRSYHALAPEGASAGGTAGGRGVGGEGGGARGDGGVVTWSSGASGLSERFLIMEPSPCSYNNVHVCVFAYVSVRGWLRQCAFKHHSDNLNILKRRRDQTAKVTRQRWTHPAALE